MMNNLPISVQLDEMIKQNKVYRLQNELEYVKVHDVARESEVKEQLEKTLSEKPDYIVKLEKLSGHVTFIEENQFKKKWGHLKQHQKLDRIRLYCKTNNILPEDEDAYIKYQQDVGLLASNVVYDTAAGILKNISYKCD